MWQTHLQIQDLAIRCVQKNIKKNKGVKDWPWWKLFTTVRPLIQVQLSEEQIRNKDVRDLQGLLGPGRDSMYTRVLLVCLGLRYSWHQVTELVSLSFPIKHLSLWNAVWALGSFLG